jgi:hypothetical protein
MKRAALFLCALGFSVGCLGQENPKPPPLKGVLGTYRYRADGSVLRIKALNDERSAPPASDLLIRDTAEKVQIFGQLTWDGTYENGHIVVKTKPTWELMNPAIPEWARKQVAEKQSLEWKIDFKVVVDDLGTHLDGYFYPGEIEWREVADPNTNEPFKRTVTVTGAPGEPIHLFEYRKFNAPWAVANTTVVATETRESDSGAPNVYWLFAYGPSMPKHAIEVKEIKSDHAQVRYEAVAAEGDPMTGEIEARWKRGWEIARANQDEAGLKQLKSWQAVLLRCKVDPGSWPAAYRYDLGGTHGFWPLHQGTTRAEIHFARKITLNDDNLQDRIGYESTNFAYEGETVQVEVKLGQKIEAGKINLVFAAGSTYLMTGGDWMITVFRDAGDPLIYRSEPIRIVNTWEHEFLGSAGGGLVAPLRPGERLHAQVADPSAFVMTTPRAELVVGAATDTPWMSAVRKAARHAGYADVDPNDTTLSSKTIESISERYYTQYVFKAGRSAAAPGALQAAVRFWEWYYNVRDLGSGPTTLTNTVQIRDHAAAILWREHALCMLEASQQILQKIKTEEEQIAYVLRAVPAMETSALGALQIYDPFDRLAPASVTGRTYAVREFLDSPPLSLRSNALAWERYQGPWKWSEAQREARRTKVCLAAFAELLRSAEKSLRKAKSIPESDVQGLLELAGQGYYPDGADPQKRTKSPVAEDLAPRLMKPVVDEASGRTQWVPDYYARAAVKQVYTTWQAIHAAKEWAELDTAMLLTFAMALDPAAGALGYGRVVAAMWAGLAAYQGVNATFDYFKREAEYEFAQGAAHVLGNDRFIMAAQQRSTYWPVVLNVVAVGMALHGAAQILPNIPAKQVSEQLPKVMAAQSKQEAVALGYTLATRIEKSGVNAFFEATTPEQAGLMNCLTALELETLPTGATLTPFHALSMTSGQKELFKSTGKAILAETQRLEKLAFPELFGEVGTIKATVEVPSPNIAATVVEPLPVPKTVLKGVVEVRSAEETVVTTLLPTVGCAFEGVGGKPYVIEKSLGGGNMFAAWKEKGKALAVKVPKSLQDETELRQLMEGVKEAKRIVEKYDIPHVKVGTVANLREAPVPYYEQELFKDGYKEFRDLLQREPLDPTTILAKDGVPVPIQQSEFEAARAQVEELLARIWNAEKDPAAKIVYEDAHVGNILLEPGSPDAKLSDLDRIFQFNNPTAKMKEAVCWHEFTAAKNAKGGFKGHPAMTIQESNFTAETFQLYILQARGWIRYDKTTGKRIDGMLRVNRLRELGCTYVDIEGVVDLTQRFTRGSPSTPRVPRRRPRPSRISVRSRQGMPPSNRFTFARGGRVASTRSRLRLAHDGFGRTGKSCDATGRVHFATSKTSRRRRPILAGNSR